MKKQAIKQKEHILREFCIEISFLAFHNLKEGRIEKDPPTQLRVAIDELESEMKKAQRASKRKASKRKRK